MSIRFQKRGETVAAASGLPALMLDPVLRRRPVPASAGLVMGPAGLPHQLKLAVALETAVSMPPRRARPEVIELSTRSAAAPPSASS